MKNLRIHLMNKDGSTALSATLVRISFREPFTCEVLLDDGAVQIWELSRIDYSMGELYAWTKVEA